MRYFEKDGLAIPKKYLKMSAEQLDKRCKRQEKIMAIFSKIMPSPKKVTADKVVAKFNL
ncbi:MAG: hypothetical protein ACI4TK_12880 [Agathobacter sp.]